MEKLTQWEIDNIAESISRRIKEPLEKKVIEDLKFVAVEIAQETRKEMLYALGNMFIQLAKANEGGLTFNSSGTKK